MAKFFCVLVALAVVSSSIAAQTKAEPLMGTWQVNLEKTNYNMAPPPKSQTLTWKPSADGSFTFTTASVTAQGQKTGSQMTARFDGNDYPVKGSANTTSRAFKRLDDRTYEEVSKLNGKVTLTRTHKVSPDGKTLTITATGTNADGQKVNMVTVFDKE